MSDRTVIARTEKLFATVAAGVITLPESVHDARGRLQAVQQTLRDLPVPADEWDTRRALAATVAAGAELDVTPILELQAAAEHRGIAESVLRLAVDEAISALRASIVGNYETILAEHIGPAQASVIEQVRAAQQAVANYGDDMRRLLTAPKAAREAFAAIDGLVGEWQLVRQAFGILRDFAGDQVQADTHNLFSVIRNTESDAVWPIITGNRSVSTLVPPWPSDLREFVLWVARPEVETWTPSADQQDARWHEVFGERVAKNQRNNESLQVFREHPIAPSWSNNSVTA